MMLPNEMIIALLVFHAEECRRTGAMHPILAKFLRAAGYEFPAYEDVPDIVAFELDSDKMKRLRGLKLPRGPIPAR